MRAALLATLALVAGCNNKATELLLTISSDIMPPAMKAVEIAIAENPDAGFVDGGSSSTCICIDPTDNTDPHCSSAPKLTFTSNNFSFVVPLVPGHQGTNSFTVDARAHAESGCTKPSFLTEEAVTEFVAHEELAISLVLSSVCLGVECDSGQTCDPDTGTCKNNMTMGGHPDMQAPPPDQATPPDLATVPFDLAVPSGPFVIASPAPDSWDVAAGDYVFSVITRAGSAIQWGPLAGGVWQNHNTITAKGPTGEVCAVHTGKAFLFGGAEESATFTSGSVYQLVNGTPMVIGGSNVVSHLSCSQAPSATATFAWLETPSGSTSNTLQLVSGIGGTTPTTARTVAAVTSYALSKERDAQHVGFAYGGGISAGPTPSGAPTGTGAPGCGAAVTEADLTGVVITNPCVPINPAQPFAVADNALRRAFLGASLSVASTYVFGSDTMPSPVGSFSASQASMIGLGETFFALAFISSSSTGVQLFGADLSTSAAKLVMTLGTKPDPQHPVKMAASAVQLLVTWIEGAQLMGQIVALPASEP